MMCEHRYSYPNQNKSERWIYLGSSTSWVSFGSQTAQGISAEIFTLRSLTSHQYDAQMGLVRISYIVFFGALINVTLR